MYNKKVSIKYAGGRKISRKRADLMIAPSKMEVTMNRNPEKPTSGKGAIVGMVIGALIGIAVGLTYLSSAIAPIALIIGAILGVLLGDQVEKEVEKEATEGMKKG